MRELSVYIEINGDLKYAGHIVGKSYTDAVFQYSSDYMDSAYGAPISISLPLRSEPFTPEQTRCFFDGLLPEGFSRRAVSDWIRVDENDYLTILAVLGSECLGAIRITEGDVRGESGYEELSLEQVKELANEGATRSTQILIKTHLSLAGATGKVGLYYDESTDRWFLPKGNAPSTHIIKQSHVRLKNLVVNEQLCVMTAGKLGLNIPESFIIDTGNGSDSDILYATRRYDRRDWSDRMIDGLRVPYRAHQEDFAQALGIPASDKYEKTDSGYLGKMFDLIRSNCENPLEDQTKLWKMICFNYLIGNTDCHIKNHSLIYDSNLRGIRLAPSYDMVSTQIYNMSGDMSFYIGGKLDIHDIGRDDLSIAANRTGLAPKYATQILDRMADSFEQAITESCAELTDLGFENASSVKDGILKNGGISLL